MFSVKIGTTNFDGTGSAINLATDNADLIFEGNDAPIEAGEIEKNGSSASSDVIDDGTLYAKAASWNAEYAKEIQIDTTGSINVDIEDFVDIDLNLSASTVGITVDVANSKRGEIDTGSAADIINVSVKSNNATWDNTFVINSGSGKDTITLTDSENSQFTQLDIDAGSSNDIIDISGLNGYYLDDASARVIDGGNGKDLIIGSDGSETLNGGDGNDIINAGNGNNIIDGGSNNDTITTGDGNNTIDGGDGVDTITAGAGNDIIDGGNDSDTIDAGAGNDSVTYGIGDSIDGGDGLDLLIIDSSVDNDFNLENTKNFEAIIAQSEVDDVITIDLTDGLIVSLGGDAGDQLKFNDSESFSESNAALSAEMIDFASSHGIDIGSLNAYESGGDTIWTDVALV